MDKKYVIEVHAGEDYVSFTVNGKERSWTYSQGKSMLELLKKFCKELV